MYVLKPKYNLTAASLIMPLQQVKIYVKINLGQNNFQIVHRPKPNLIKIVESVVIHQQKPTLNNMDSSIPLKILS